MSSGTLMIGRNEAMKAMNDEEFLSKFPMFKTIKNKAAVLKKSIGAGCSSCRKKRIMSDLTADFLNVLKVVSKEDAAKIKEYFGAEKMMYTMFDSNKGIYRMEVV